MDPGVHLVDLLLWWLGDYPDSVEYRDDDFGGGIEAECRIEFGFGGTASGTVKVSRLSKLRNTYVFQCERGTITYSPFDFSSIFVESQGSKKEVTAKDRTDFIGYFRLMLRDFCRAVRMGGPSALQAETVAASMRLIEQCYGAAARLELPWLRPRAR